MTAEKTKARLEKASEDGAVVVKKYANRRLYNTATSSYVTLEDLSAMLREGVDFVVYDAKSGEDITRSVLTQIIFEQESRGQNLLPIQFLRRLIRFYGDSLQAFLPSYLEMSIESFERQREKMRERFAETWTPGKAMEAFEEQTRQNMAFFEQALKMFTPFSAAASGRTDAPPGPAARPADGSEPAGQAETIAELRRQMEAMQKRLDQIAAPGRKSE